MNRTRPRRRPKPVALRRPQLLVLACFSGDAGYEARLQLGGPPYRGGAGGSVASDGMEPP